MCKNHEALFAAALVAAAVVLEGCAGGGAAPEPPAPDLMTMLCSDATARAVESTDLVHEHLDEIQTACRNETELGSVEYTELGSVKACEDGKIAGIDAAEQNITKFYTKRCVENFTEWLGEPETTLELLHRFADQFETMHEDEITAELHAGIHRGIEEGKAGAQSSFEVVCIHEVEKEVQSNGDLVHEHLNEIEQGCAGKKDVLKCEDVSAKGVLGAIAKVTSEYQDHCKDPTTWSLWAVHPAVDNFATVHKTEMKDELHKAIHEAMEDTGSGGDMISALCADATAKDVVATDLVHEHMHEVQQTCITEQALLKACEDEKIAGIDAAVENITEFYTRHCEEHVKEWLGADNATLELIHTYADKFETTHKEEIEQEMHDGIHRGMEEGKTGGKTMLEIVCTHEVAKEVERDNGLIHDHLKEMEDVCDDGKEEDIAKCEADAANSIVNAKLKVISDFIDRCHDPTSWSLWAIHPAVDNFATVHEDEIKTALHKEFHNAMSVKGLESATAAFLVPRAPVVQAAPLPPGVACALLVMVVAGLAATVGAAGRLTRQRALPLTDYQHQESDGIPEPQELLLPTQ